MLLYTIVMLLRSDCKFYIIKDYIVAHKYTLTNIDYIHVSSLIHDQIVGDPYH
jgi:hypothetical protein